MSQQWSDHGTENVQVEALQIGLRFDHTDDLSGPNSFLTGKSTQNQRIESFWVQLQRLNTHHYMDMFKQMTELGYLDVKNKIQIEYLRFCFGPLIRHDLNCARKEWNQHRIRRQNNRNFSGGRPNILFGLPENYGAIDNAKQVQERDVEILYDQFTTEPRLYDPGFEEVVQILMPAVKIPCNSQEALKLYFDLWDEVSQHISEK